MSLFLEEDFNQEENSNEIEIEIEVAPESTSVEIEYEKSMELMQLDKMYHTSVQATLRHFHNLDMMLHLNETINQEDTVSMPLLAFVDGPSFRKLYNIDPNMSLEAISGNKDLFVSTESIGSFLSGVFTKIVSTVKSTFKAISSMLSAFKKNVLLILGFNGVVFRGELKKALLNKTVTCLPAKKFYAFVKASINFFFRFENVNWENEFLRVQTGFAHEILQKLKTESEDLSFAKMPLKDVKYLKLKVVKHGPDKESVNLVFNDMFLDERINDVELSKINLDKRPTDYVSVWQTRIKEGRITISEEAKAYVNLLKEICELILKLGAACRKSVDNVVKEINTYFKSSEFKKIIEAEKEKYLKEKND